jgi:hypothetical protein
MRLFVEVNTKNKIIKISGNINKTDCIRLKKVLADVHLFEKTVLDLSEAKSINLGLIKILMEFKQKHPAAYKRIKLFNRFPYVDNVLNGSLKKEIV